MVRKAVLILFALCFLGVSNTAFAQSAYPFVDDGFEVPEELVTKDFRLRMLSIDDAVKDYAAVMASKLHLMEMFPEWRGWPEGLTLENNTIDLGWKKWSELPTSKR